MTIELLYFARVRESIGRDGERIDPPASVRTVGDLIDWLVGRDAVYDAAFADRARLRAALDQRFVPLDEPIADARELALFPPVTGG